MSNLKKKVEFIERCENRISFLNNKLQDNQKNGEEVKEANKKTKASLLQQSVHLKENLCKLVDQHLDSLYQNVDKVTSKDEEYLKELNESITKDISKLNSVSADAQLLVEENIKKIEEMEAILTDIGKCMPEVPLVSLSFSSKLGESALVELGEKIKETLQVVMTGSVQIVECLERPGSIIVKWDEQQASDSESVTTDASLFTEYLLQVCDKPPTMNDEELIFNTVYEGDDMQYTMNFAEPNQPYYFRVCHYYTNSSGVGFFGPWSITKKASTTMSPHVWRCEDCVTDSELQLYQLSNKDRTATKVFPERSRILRSQAPSYTLGQTLTFWIEETGDSSINDGIGFIEFDAQSLKQLTLNENAAVLNTQGAIFVNGTQMVTRLPALQRNSVLYFTASKLKPGKLRVTISLSNKEVTFDWTVSESVQDTTKLFFACGFEHTGWQVSVG